MATQTIAKAFDSPFVCYDIVQFGAHTWWAGEYCPRNANYAAGAGPGLFQRLRGATGVPTPVAGSETYRFYALTVFDGKLVAFGCLTADVLALLIPSYLSDDGAPIRWWHNPPLDLYVFTSSNAVPARTSAWTHRLGAGSYNLVAARTSALVFHVILPLPGFGWTAGRVSRT